MTERITGVPLSPPAAAEVARSIAKSKWGVNNCPPWLASYVLGVPYRVQHEEPMRLPILDPRYAQYYGWR